MEVTYRRLNQLLGARILPHVHAIEVLGDPQGHEPEVATRHHRESPAEGDKVRRVFKPRPPG